jgi:hypothetical protein
MLRTAIRFSHRWLNLLNNRSPRPGKTQPPHHRPLLLEPLESRAVPASVTDYGAVGDGSHDDTAAFQAAIDNAPIGGIVDIPAPAVAYQISDVLLIDQPITIRGMGSAPLLKMASPDTAMFYVYSSNVVIKNLTLAGFQAATSQPNALAIWSGGAAYGNQSFTNLVVNHWHDGIAVSHATNANTTGCTISDIVYSGVDYASVQGGVIANNTISNCHGDPLGDTSCYGIAVSRNVYAGELTDDPNSSYVTVSNNTVSDVAWEGIDTHGGQNLSFIGNKLYRCLNGIAVMSSTNYAGTYVYPPSTARSMATSSTVNRWARVPGASTSMAVWSATSAPAPSSATTPSPEPAASRASPTAASRSMPPKASRSATTPSPTPSAPGSRSTATTST